MVFPDVHGRNFYRRLLEKMNEDAEVKSQIEWKKESEDLQFDCQPSKCGKAVDSVKSRLIWLLSGTVNMTEHLFFMIRRRTMFFFFFLIL